MVSIDARSAYWARLRTSPLTSFFIDLLEARAGLVVPELDLSDTASVACNMIDYVRRGDAAAAASLYQALTTRQVRAESIWLHNDFWVFAVVCAVRRFQLDSKWIREVLQKRQSTDRERSLINRSFENVLAGNLNAREDLHQISLVYQVLAQQEQFDAGRLHKMFAYLWRHDFPYFDSEFLNILSLQAIRIAFEAKGLLNPEERYVAEEFGRRFMQRTAKVTKILTYLPYLLVVAGLAICAGFYQKNPTVSIMLGVLSSLGWGASFFGDVRGWLTPRVEKRLRRFWGYDPPSTGEKQRS